MQLVRNSCLECVFVWVKVCRYLVEDQWNGSKSGVVTAGGFDRHPGGDDWLEWGCLWVSFLTS